MNSPAYICLIVCLDLVCQSELQVLVVQFIVGNVELVRTVSPVIVLQVTVLTGAWLVTGGGWGWVVARCHDWITQIMFVILIHSGVSTLQTGSDQWVGQPCPGLWSPAGEWCLVQQVLSRTAHAHRRQWKILGLNKQVRVREQEIQELTAVYVLRLSIYYWRLDNIKSYKYPMF